MLTTLDFSSSDHTLYKKAESTKYKEIKMRLQLDMIPWNEADMAISEMYYTGCEEMERRGDVVGGFFKSTVTTEGGGEPIEVETRQSYYGYVKYNVFVAKIRRESNFMEEKTQDARTKWTEMVQAFIDHYGETKTPSDIVERLSEVRERWSIAPDSSLIVDHNPDTKWLMFGSITVGNSSPGTIVDSSKLKVCHCLDHQADESLLECRYWLKGFTAALAVVDCQPEVKVRHWKGKHIVLIGPLSPVAAIAAKETVEYLGIQSKAHLLVRRESTEDTPDEPISAHSQHQDDADNGTI